MYGAGCWAQREMACSVSGWLFSKMPNEGIWFKFNLGAGEHIIRTALARSIGEAFMMFEDADPHDILHRTLVENFWSALILPNQ